jgi:Hint domain
MASVFKGLTGDWTTAANWSTNAVPADTDTATINKAASIVQVNTSPDAVDIIKLSAGTIQIGAGATLEANRLVQSGTGKLIFTGNGVRQIDASVSGAAVDFGGVSTDGTVVWDAGSRNTLSDLTLQNFFAGDELQIVGNGSNVGLAFVYAGSSTSGTVTITRKSGQVGVVNVSDSSGGLGQDVFSVHAARGVITLDTSLTCFLHGTRIATPGGEVAVQDLRIGDLVTTAGGGALPVKWIGTRGFIARLVDPDARADLLPIRIARGALGEATPVRDLYVSPEHMMCLDDVLIPAGKLVNGTTITQAENLDVVQYFHIELPHHAVLYAEGAAAESYLDTGNRNTFANVLDYLALGHDIDAPPAPPCLPIVTDGGLLAAVRSRLAARAADLGLAATDAGQAANVVAFPPAGTRLVREATRLTA